MKDFLSNLIDYIIHPSDTAVSVITGLSFSGSYLYVSKVMLSIWSMSLLEFGITCIKTAIVAGLGGFCGLLGKELFKLLKKAIEGRQPKKSK